MSKIHRPQSFRLRIREALIILFGRLPARLTIVDSLTSTQGELAQSRAELGRMAKAAAEARVRLSNVELDQVRMLEENERLKLDIERLTRCLLAAQSADSQ
jgi:hypothetical protein